MACVLYRDSGNFRKGAEGHEDPHGCEEGLTFKVGRLFVEVSPLQTFLKQHHDWLKHRLLIFVFVDGAQLGVSLFATMFKS